MLVIAALSCALGVALLRVGWRRRKPVVAAGWTLILLGLVGLAALAGAWGLAVGTLSATFVAAVALGHAAAATPAGRTSPPREAPAIGMPRPNLRDIGHRLGVFAVIVPAALVASGFLALAAYRVARVPLGETDATVLAIALVPITWIMLASVQLTRATLVAMLPPLVVVGALGGLAWITS